MDAVILSRLFWKLPNEPPKPQVVLPEHVTKYVLPFFLLVSEYVWDRQICTLFFSECELEANISDTKEAFLLTKERLPTKLTVLKVLVVFIVIHLIFFCLACFNIFSEFLEFLRGYCFTSFFLVYNVFFFITG